MDRQGESDSRVSVDLTRREEVVFLTQDLQVQASRMLFASIVDGFTNIRSLVQLSVCFRDHESSIFVDSMPLRRWQFTSS